MPRQPVMLVSVLKKDGIEDPVGRFSQLGGHIIASRGTCEHLTKFGIHAMDVADYTGEEPWMQHLVVTIHPKIEGGLMVPDTEAGHAHLAEKGALFIDILFNTMYDMASAIALPGATPESVRKDTDVGAIAMRHAAVKGNRICAGSADRLNQVLATWEQGGVPDELRRALCSEMEMECAIYLLNLARFLSGGQVDGFIGRVTHMLKYGENPFQIPADLLADPGDNDPLGIQQFEFLEGTAPSFINVRDYTRLIYLFRRMYSTFQVNGRPNFLFAAAIKHGNPCGAAFGTDPVDVMRRVIDGSPLSVMGGVVMTNFTVNPEVAEILTRYQWTAVRPRPMDGVLAPSFDDGAVDILRREKTQKCRMLANPALGGALPIIPRMHLSEVPGGWARQPTNTRVLDLTWRFLTRSVQCSPELEDDLLFATGVCSSSPSNTVTVVKNRTLYANGACQPDRVGCVEVADHRMKKSKLDPTGSVLCSDSFLPDEDGARAIVALKPGLVFTTSGSINDKRVFPVFAEAGTPVYSVPDTEGRMFFGHG
ncbi:MAG: hypothetical protein A2898_01405 [Candidatus Kerfeldbacteria bacterium RIFCSPLOWO2_01_FULL_48_11]|uniref:MGS-like domain-containing protein n=1 Tax=Candidatus Kerfeldbacteria bacterium RIFCSPLOWO2_01_FULL_48_11 TaxID=1798543 RepID=A0A1G2B1E3_9BACT|nr:MAG: Phosphoribosylaminoimidazolecarboxamide formyltransferase [Parcubacteria group bacterium GW2011_GWA2_48_9]OGY82509.1 MAG: hypothetical protein A2898_01405 [Candidatus Kerfeldbacteria bacterium RIFCSPLOWO2_01_FULL_48_11]